MNALDILFNKEDKDINETALAINYWYSSEPWIYCKVERDTHDQWISFETKIVNNYVLKATAGKHNYRIEPTVEGRLKVIIDMRW